MRNTVPNVDSIFAYIQVRGIRNQLFHSHDFSVTRGELNAKLADMVALLQDRTTLFEDSSAQEAVHEIQAVNHVH